MKRVTYNNIFWFHLALDDDDYSEQGNSSPKKKSGLKKRVKAEEEESDYEDYVPERRTTKGVFTAAMCKNKEAVIAFFSGHFEADESSPDKLRCTKCSSSIMYVRENKNRGLRRHLATCGKNLWAQSVAGGGCPRDNVREFFKRVKRERDGGRIMSKCNKCKQIVSDKSRRLRIHLAKCDPPTFASLRPIYGAEDGGGGPVPSTTKQTLTTPMPTQVQKRPGPKSRTMRNENDDGDYAQDENIEKGENREETMDN